MDSPPWYADLATLPGSPTTWQVIAEKLIIEIQDENSPLARQIRDQHKRGIYSVEIEPLFKGTEIEEFIEPINKLLLRRLPELAFELRTRRKSVEYESFRWKNVPVSYLHWFPHLAQKK